MTTPMLPGLGGGVAGAQPTGTLPTPQANPQLAMTALNSPSPVVTAQPKPTSPQVQSAGNAQAPLLSASGGAILPQGAMPTPVPMTDLLTNPPPAPQLTQYGSQAPSQTATSDIAEKYKSLYDKVQNYAESATNPMRSKEMQDALSQSAPEQKEDAQKTFIDNYQAMNPVVKQMFDNMQKTVDAVATKQSFTDKLTETLATSGLQGFQTELMDVKKLLRGQQDAVAQEIRNAGGTASAQQIRAVTDARNKVLLEQGAQLTDQINAAQGYVDMIMKYSTLDRAEVEKQVDRQLGLDKLKADYAMNMDNAAKDNYKFMIQQGGYKGLSEAFSDNSSAMRQAEATLGLPKGALQNQAFLDAMKDPNEEAKKFQFVSGTDNQQSGVFDPTTGTFKGMGGGGSGGGGGTTGGNSVYTNALQNIMAYGKTGPQTRPSLINQLNTLVASGDLEGVKKYLTSNAIGNLPADQQNAAIGRSQALAALNDINGLLDAASAKGAGTNLLTGSLVDIQERLGTTSNPDLNYIGARMKTALQSYRRSMTGVAFGPQEAAEYKKVFPDLYSVDTLNSAKISALRDSFNAFNRAAMATPMGGPDVYDQIYGPPETAILPSDRTAPTKPGDLVIVDGTMYEVAPDGDTINPYNPTPRDIDFSGITSGTVNGGKSFF